jgi:hypothetical protein
MDTLINSEMHNAVMKCLFIVNRSCMHKDFRCLTGKNPKGNKCKWMLWSWFSCTYLSFMIGVFGSSSSSFGALCKEIWAMVANVAKYGGLQITNSSCPFINAEQLLVSRMDYIMRILLPFNVCYGY